MSMFVKQGPTALSVGLWRRGGGENEKGEEEEGQT